MSCSGQHFSIHSPDCKAHMSIQSNRPIQVDTLASNSQVTTPTFSSPSRQTNQIWSNNTSNQNPTTMSSTTTTTTATNHHEANSPSMLQIQTLVGGDCQQLVGVSPVPSGGHSPLVGHHETSDGNYTLVILDCSPHPDNRLQQQQLRDNSSSRQLIAQSGSCESFCRDCLSGCHCQTELIVRQQIEHDHSCQHHSNRQAFNSLSGHDQQQLIDSHSRHFGSGSIADRSASQTTNMTTSTSNITTTHQQDTLQTPSNKYEQPQQQADHEHGRRSNSGGDAEPFQQGPAPSWHHYETLKRVTETDRWNNERPGSQSKSSPVLGDEQQQQQSDPHRPLSTRKPRDGMRIIKRWNWNQAQFVEEEVPDQPSPKPTTTATAQLNSNHGSHLQVGGGGQQQQPQTRGQNTDLWNQQIQDICLSLSPVPSSGQQHYDPSWLAYRKPDEESVQADPLYRDLMMELQRLEDGVNGPPQPEPIITPDCFQKPVFGQPIQPDSVELEEHENVEFIARLIPNSDPTMRVEWTKNGQPLMESSRLDCEYEFGVVRLAIRRCEAEDSGVYQCRASNLLGEAVSRSRLLVHAKNSVQYDTLHPAGLDKIRQLENPPQVDYPEEQPLQQAPKFLSHIQDYVEKDEGESVHFECNLAPVDDPDIKIEWFFNGRPLVTGSRFHTIDDFGFIVLDIDWLFPRDTGEYICRATNKHGTSFTRTVLRVRPAKNIILDSQLDNADAIIDKLYKLEYPDVQQEQQVFESQKPAQFLRPLQVIGPDPSGRRHFIEGDSVCFQAQAGPATDGQLTVEWFHNGKPLMSGSRFKPTFDFGHIQLELLYVYPEDSGTYKCVARNGQGQAESELDIFVQGKQSIVYQSQLPREMQGGVEKITEMEAMWNRAPDPEEEEAPQERLAPQFVLKPKPCQAFEGSCARFCCRILAHPRPRVAWFINDQLVVSGARYKLTHDGMYHLIIPKCALTDAGRVEVRAKNLLGECRSQTELVVKRKVDDYRGVLKNSPNPWYDETTLRMYRRARNSDQNNDDEGENDYEDFEEFLANFQKQQRQQQQLKLATQLEATSPNGGLAPTTDQLIDYMEPETPDVNLLISSHRSPLVEPGDLHPVVIEQQVIHAPAPSTIKWALDHKPEEERSSGGAAVAALNEKIKDSAQDSKTTTTLQDSSGQSQQRQVFGVGNSQQQQQQLKQQAQISLNENQRQRLMMSPTPENVEHGKEIHSHFHTQLQVERRPNKEITREIIEKETFEQEHRGFSRDNLQTIATSDQQQQQRDQQRSVTPVRTTSVNLNWQQQAKAQSGGGYNNQQQMLQVVGEEFPMVPPEFLVKIQPCQAIDGDEARFECEFRGDPKPTISWLRDNKQLKASNLYAIETDLEKNKSSLIIRRVTLQSNAVYTVRADNAAGSAKSSANLVVEPHPIVGARGGHARQFDALEHLESIGAGGGSIASRQQQQQFVSDARGFAASPTVSDYDDSSLQGELASLTSRQLSPSPAGGGGGQKVIKSVRTRRLSPDDLNSLIRASPESQVAPTFLHTIHEVHAKLGDLARLDARLIGGRPMEVKWLKDGQRVRADKQHKLLLEGDLYTLLILECSQRDEGYYECVASNGVGEASCGASLRVSPEGRLSAAGANSSTSPSISATRTYVMQSAQTSGQSSMSSRSVGGGQQTTMSSAANQTLAPSTSSSATSSTAIKTTPIQWQQQQVAGSSQVSIGQQETRQHFGLTKQPHHQLMSEYTPAQDSSLSPSQQQQQLGSWIAGTTSANLTALPKLIKGLESQKVVEGKSVTLRCQISAFPKTEIVWLRQGDKQIKPSKYFRIFKDNDETHCLKILETFPEDQGEYKCVARAQNGQIETRAFISVLPSSDSAGQK